MPSKRVSDIISPKDKKETAPLAKPQKKTAISEKLILPKKKVISDKTPKPQSEKHAKLFWWPTLTILVLICLAGASYILIKPKAEISVWPKKSPLVVKTQVVVGKDIAKEIETQECSSSQEFPATGTKTLNTKASGTVRVYNAYSTTPQILIANTRFVSDNGKLFRTPQKIVIPGAHYEGSKLVPGEADATLEAGEAGEEYNIDPSTFSLPALAGTSRYTAFYAKSSSSMTGGSKSQTSQVTQEDLDSAEDSLSDIALENCEKTLQSSLPPEDFIINNDALQADILEITSPAKAGDSADNFTLSIKAKATALSFKKSDLEAFTKTYIESKVPEGKQLDQNSIAISYSPENIDLTKGKIFLNVEISSQIYSTIDEDNIKEAAISKRSEEITAALKQFSELDKFQLRLWPFWANKAPFEKEGVIIKLRLD